MRYNFMRFPPWKPMVSRLETTEKENPCAPETETQGPVINSILLVSVCFTE